MTRGNEDTPREKRIVADFGRIGALLATIAPPAGHSWLASPRELRWWGNLVEPSVESSGASVFLRRDRTDDYDALQLHVEARIFWEGIRNPAHGDALRCILWCEMGPRINFTSTSLIGPRAAFLYAPGVDEMFAKLRDVLESAFAAHLERQPPMTAPRDAPHRSTENV